MVVHIIQMGNAFMKTFTRLGIILLLSVTSAFASASSKPVKWLDNFAAAQAAAKKEGRPILANFTGSDWCPWCMKLEKEVFSQKEFQNYASSNLVLFIADFPNGKRQSAQIAKQNKGLETKYAVKGFPTVLLLDADGNVLGQTGYMPGGAEPFVENLKNLLDKSGWKPATATNQTAKAAAPAAK